MALWAQVRIAKLPNNMTFGCHLEGPTLLGTRDQCVAVREPLARSAAGGEEVLGRGCPMIPHYLLCDRVELNDAGSTPPESVVEY